MTQEISEIAEHQEQEHVHTEESLHEDLKIPKDRVAVLIGSGGATKRDLEKKTECRINVDSAEGLVEISGHDALRLFDCKDIVLAIGNPLGLGGTVTSGIISSINIYFHFNIAL